MPEREVRYVNPRSGAEWPVTTALWRAPDDGGYLNLSPGAGFALDDLAVEKHSMWRYEAAIRLPGADVISLGEGGTPLVEGDWEGMAVQMKCEHLMPSGSFKDRGTAVMLNYLRQTGVTNILEDSSGNAGASIATFAAALGLDCRILVPAAAPAAKKMQIAAMGAEVVGIEGRRQDVAEAALAEAETVFYASHNWQPYFIEGTKTLAFELWDQLGRRAPDWVVVPLGYGSNVIGLHLGFTELTAAGLIDRVPRIGAVQAANCAVFEAAWRAGGAPVEIEARPTLADGIACERPVRLGEVMAALGDTGGTVIAVEEVEIAAALRGFAEKGYFIEPTSATVGAALTRLRTDSVIGPDETVVAVLTGSGLKAVEKIGGMLKTGAE